MFDGWEGGDLSKCAAHTYGTVKFTYEVWQSDHLSTKQ